MIKIKIYELDKHRNECAFRPYLAAQEILNEIGIQFTNGDSYDYAWIGQASFLNKKVSLEESVNTGLEFLSKIDGDYMLLDAQDSTSLMGSYEVFKESNAILMLKNSMLKDRSLYKQGLALGRYYWGAGDYKIDDFDAYSDRIVLSGTNWLSTHWAGINVQWHNIDRPRNYDVSAMFGYPAPESYEHLQLQSDFYNQHRKPSIDVINNLSSDIKVAKLINGQRVSAQEYHQKMFDSKIIFTPYGYGSIFPRDLEAAMYGSILIKPDMSFNDTTPDVFIDGETYIACKHDFSDLEEKIEMILGNYKNYHYIIENARNKFKEVMDPHCIATHLYNLFKNLKGVTTN
jgi:hypothetical protein|tara:strand:+ start:337 stop:1368 length:1032 start_codon:yes stop_codon:yes gene_type:complete